MNLPYVWKDKNNKTLVLVKIRTGSKKSCIGDIIEVNTHYPVKSALIVYVSEQAKENKANLELIEVLAKHFNVSRGNITLIQGLKSKLKVIELTD